MCSCTPVYLAILRNFTVLKYSLGSSSLIPSFGCAFMHLVSTKSLVTLCQAFSVPSQRRREGNRAAAGRENLKGRLSDRNIHTYPMQDASIRGRCEYNYCRCISGLITLSKPTTPKAFNVKLRVNWKWNSSGMLPIPYSTQQISIFNKRRHKCTTQRSASEKSVLWKSIVFIESGTKNLFHHLNEQMNDCRMDLVKFNCWKCMSLQLFG